MVIYRIEKNGEGPFWRSNEDISSSLKNKVSLYSKKLASNIEEYPTPIMDGQMRLYSLDGLNLKYGCASIKDLFHWFDEDIRNALFKEGFEIKEYRAGVDFVDMLKGKRQVAIVPDQETKELLDKRFMGFILW